MKLSFAQHLLVCLGEEGVEVAKDVDKSLRFGLDDRNLLEPDGPTNREKIIGELNDLMGAVRLCVIHGILPADWQSEERIIAKGQKILSCMKYAQKVGALEIPGES